MKEYAAFLTVRLAYPLADFRQWRLLPSAAAEQYLAGHKMRLSFNDGELRFWGEEGFGPRASEVEEGVPFLEFYLFCANPYFMRAGEIPLFRPGEELLLLSLSSSRETPDMETIKYSRERQEEVAQGRKKYFGSAFGAPPVAILRFAAPRRDVPQSFRIEIPARRVYWVYRIHPKPAAPLCMQGACGFHRREKEGEEGAAVFMSNRPLSLTAKGIKGIHLLFEDEQGRLVPLVENLPSPGMEGIVWEEGVGGYVGTVHMDLSAFGAVV